MRHHEMGPIDWWTLAMAFAVIVAVLVLTR